MKPHLFTRVSPVTGKENDRVIELDWGDYVKWQQGHLIQEVLPYVSADDREFLMTGILPEEWAEMFRPTEEELAFEDLDIDEEHAP